MSEKSYSLQIGWSAQLWGSEVQSFSMLGTPARLCQHPAPDGLNTLLVLLPLRSFPVCLALSFLSYVLSLARSLTPSLFTGLERWTAWKSKPRQRSARPSAEPRTSPLQTVTVWTLARLVHAVGILKIMLKIMNARRERVRKLYYPSDPITNKSS